MIGLLKGNRAFSRLTVSRFVSNLGSFFTYMLLIVLSYGKTHSVGLTMGITVAAAIGAMVAGGIAGVAVDRGSPLGIMVRSELGSAAVLVVLFALPSSLWISYGASFAIAFAAAFFTPALHKFQVASVDQDKLMDANAILQTINEIVKIAGPALAVFVLSLLPSGEKPVGFLIDAISYAASAALLGTLRAPRAPGKGEAHEPQPPKRGYFSQWAEGLSPLKDLTVAMVAVEYIFLLLGVSGADVLMTAYVGQSGYPTIDVGYLLSALSAGLILSAIALKGTFARWPVAAQLGATGLAMGVFYGGIAIFPSLAVMLASSFFLGIFNGIYNVSANTYWQRAVPEAQLGRFFAVVTSVFGIVSVVGMGATGTLGTLIGPRDTLLIFGGLIALSGLVGTILIARAHSRRAVPSKGESVT